jgi:hypothetical protein
VQFRMHKYKICAPCKSCAYKSWNQFWTVDLLLLYSNGWDLCQYCNRWPADFNVMLGTCGPTKWLNQNILFIFLVACIGLGLNYFLLPCSNMGWYICCNIYLDENYENNLHFMLNYFFSTWNCILYVYWKIWKCIKIR